MTSAEQLVTFAYKSLSGSIYRIAFRAATHHAYSQITIFRIYLMVLPAS